MSLAIAIPAVAAAIGLVLLAVCKEAPLAELGRALLWMGLLVLLLVLTGAARG